MTLDLDLLYQHEAAYYAFSSELEEQDWCWYLSCPDLPESRDVNRALRLRDDGRGPEAVAREVLSHFRAAGTRVSAEIDPVSEAQGIGFALRRLGITPVIQSRSLMRLAGCVTTREPPELVQVIEVDKRNEPSLLETWIETNPHDVDMCDDAGMWRTLTTREAQSPAVRLYIGLWNGQPASTCSLFQANGMGRIEMVETRSDYRRRGLASAVVARAAADSALSGDAVTYLYTNSGSDVERLYKRLGFGIGAVNLLHRHIEA